jgi:hypothetical protein
VKRILAYLKGVIICDGGAHVLRNMGGSFAYSVRDIVFHALKRHTSIDFVVIISLRDSNLQPQPAAASSQSARPYASFLVPSNSSFCSSLSHLNWHKKRRALHWSI